jgi:thiamine-monophosphate kinase
VRLFAQSLPVSQANRALSRAACDGDEWYFALHGGEDYELLFAASPAQAETLAVQVTHQTGTPVSIIGEILPAAQGQQLVLEDGSTIPIQPRGWDHFKENK